MDWVSQSCFSSLTISTFERPGGLDEPSRFDVRDVEWAIWREPMGSCEARGNEWCDHESRANVARGRLLIGYFRHGQVALR